MEKFEIYKTIAERTNGDIYLGVVGPVRTGKSTFIRNFMEKLVLDKIKDKHERERVIDELPQSGAGRTIMTTQPKFVPNEAVEIEIGEGSRAGIRLVDCVGYEIEGASGFLEEDGTPRFVTTPWSDEELPFAEAARIGTNKVISEHSTIAIMMTTDGTIAGIDRKAYEKAEEAVVNELKNAGKPFVIVINSKNPGSKDVQALKDELAEKHGVTVLAHDVASLESTDIDDILESILGEFPVRCMGIELPSWVRALPYSSSLILDIMKNIKEATTNVVRMRDLKNAGDIANPYPEFNTSVLSNVSYGTGEATVSITLAPEIFYQLLSQECGVEIKDDFYLMSYMKHLVHAKTEYDKLESALNQVKETGYGVVVPSLDEMTLEEPQITKKGGASQVKLKATAPSLHIMRVDVETEVCPAVGSAEQSENLAKFMLSEFESNPQGIWETNMFGKPLSSFVSEGIATKIANIPTEAEVKMRRTMTKIVNEGKGGIICILL
ncbi:MAG: stage IV sporulation protein A [Clostridia bacterium]|nr:stage IV sporulation protein A [Clostridia bacterium]